MKTLALLAALTIGSVGLYAQDQPTAPPPPPPGQTLSPDQLNDLVAPIALYPDPLLSQVLVATTYPLEIVQAQQWLQRNPGLSGADLTAAAAQQNWDPSIQALVVFPDVLKRLTDDVSWTTNLGNAFVAQQQDVMDAVQRMRQQAQQAGKLASTPQENVTTEMDDGEPYVSIMPANPDVIYVPVYDPYWVWGAPRWYPYARWYYPPRSVIYSGVGFGFGGGINVGFFFGSGWHGWGGWGWHPGWGNRTVVVNNTFVSRYNFNTARVGNVRGSTVWSHSPSYRTGVSSPNAGVTQRYRDGNVRQGFERSAPVAPARTVPSERFASRPAPSSAPVQQPRQAFNGGDSGRSVQSQPRFERSNSSPAPMHSAPARSSGNGGGRSERSGGGRHN